MQRKKSLYQPARLYDGKHVIPVHSLAVRNASTCDHLKEEPVPSAQPRGRGGIVDNRKNMHGGSVDRVGYVC